MSEPMFSPECVPPGGQQVLFRLPGASVPLWSVVDRDGYVRVRTNSLGVALSVARRVLADHGEVWLRAADDTTAHVDGSGVSSDTPQVPWIASVARALEA